MLKNVEANEAAMRRTLNCVVCELHNLEICPRIAGQMLLQMHTHIVC